MRRLITIGALCLVLVVVSGCAREDPRASRRDLLNDEKSRSTQQVAELRSRIVGQNQR